MKKIDVKDTAEKGLFKNVEPDAPVPKPETFEKLHTKPVTRRDFLASGLIGFSARLALPTFLTMLAKSQSVEAQEYICKVVGGATLCPFISLKLSGGASLSGNWLPRDKGLQPLASYSLMGGGTAPPVTYEFANLAPFYAFSQILLGIRTRASLLTLANTNFVGSAVSSQDDNSTNKSDLTGLVIAAGSVGTLLPNLGKANTITGANAMPAYTPPPAPLIVGSYDDLPGSLGVQGSLGTPNLSQPQQSNLFKTIQSISATQALAVQNMSSGSLLARLLGCANKGNTNLISNVAGLGIDPLSNPAFSAVWGITANTNKSSQTFVFASMVFNCLNQNAGTANLEVGGFDYHNGTRTSGNAKDLEAGNIIGQILQSCAVMGKKAFVAVSSDGSVSSENSAASDGTPVWASDRGIAGASYMLGYDPIPHIMKSSQLGAFTNGQAADTTFMTGGSAEVNAGAVFANYMSFNGKLNLFEQFLPRVFSIAELDSVVKFT